MDTSSTQRATRHYDPIPTSGPTFLIVDRTQSTQNVQQVDGDLSDAQGAATDRANAVKDGRDVFIFQKVGHCSTKPVVQMLPDEPSPEPGTLRPAYGDSDEPPGSPT